MKRHCEDERRSNLLILLLQTISKIDCVVILRLLHQPPCKAALFPRNDVVTLVILLFSLSSNATILSVKQDGSGNYTTIQAGINAASTGDTVLVWPGTYFENINYNSKSITIASLYLTTQEESYIQSTIIDGNMNGSCVVISNCISENTILCGFTVQNGNGYSNLLSGGGIYIDNSLVLIQNCIIRNNTARYGGGILGVGSEIYLSGSIIKENKALAYTGGIFIVNNTNIYFDTLNLNSVFINYGPVGCDFSKANCPELKITLDTGSVILPDYYFFYSNDGYGYPLDDIEWQIQNGKIEQKNADLYVSPEGSNFNSGLSQNEPLKTIAFALMTILPDTLNPKTIYIASGLYSYSTNSEVLPIIQRSYVSLLGPELGISTIDGEFLFPLYLSYVNSRSYQIKNIKFIRGIDSQEVIHGNGGLNIVDNTDVSLLNVTIDSCRGGVRAGIQSVKSNISICNLAIINSEGGNPILFSNAGSEVKEVIVRNSVIMNNGPDQNIDAGYGGGVGFSGSYFYQDAARGKLINVLISQNTLTIDPGLLVYGICGLGCDENANIDVINSTIANNMVTDPLVGGEIGAGDGGKINFLNSIIYGTENYEIFLGDGQPTSYISTINISNTDVKGGEENIQNWNNIHILNWLDGNIDEDPIWDTTVAIPYALPWNSPCVNAGTPMYEPGMQPPYIIEEDTVHKLITFDYDTIVLPQTDLAGNPRIFGGRIDMGAYECQDTTTGSLKFEVQSSKLSVYPNPFTSNVFVSFSTEKELMVELQVIDMNGQEIKKIISGKLPAGNYKLVWDSKDEAGFEVKAGNYLVCLYLDSKLSGYNKMLRM